MLFIQRHKICCFVVMGCFVSITVLFICLILTGFSLRNVYSQKMEGEDEGTVFINGISSIGKTDGDFICATLDWWPPEKCDYGTCSWGSDSLLNLGVFLPHHPRKRVALAICLPREKSLLSKGGNRFGTIFRRLQGSKVSSLNDLSKATLFLGRKEYLAFYASNNHLFAFLKDLSNPILMNAIKAFSPLKIRLGGTLQDKLIYQVLNNEQPCTQFAKDSNAMFGFSQGCLPMSRWDALSIFFKQAGAKVIFGLNALTGRNIGPDGFASGAWNYTNAELLIRYTVNKGHSVFGWELGNELSGNGIGARIEANQYATDTISLYNLVQDLYGEVQDKPIVLGPGGFFHANWFTEFVAKTANSLQVITHHIYNLGPGVDEHLVEKILDPNYLDGGSQPFRDLQSILKSSGTSAVTWVGESGGAYNSGRHLVSDAFVFSFWYLDQLGMAASYDTKTYCRQTLVGGNYGLLNSTTFAPNPDYYSALLWHRLMGRNVLSTKFSGNTNMIRAYTHCSKFSEGITLLLINLDGHNTARVSLSVENATTITIAQMQQINQTKFSNMSPDYSNIGVIKRDEYHLTAKDGDLHSQTVLLNGDILTVNSSGKIPCLEPIKVDHSDPVIVAPFSVVFVHITHIQVPACIG